jgi:transcriptional regulator with AAA-type ATPase domain
MQARGVTGVGEPAQESRSAAATPAEGCAAADIRELQSLIELFRDPVVVVTPACAIVGANRPGRLLLRSRYAAVVDALVRDLVAGHRQGLAIRPAAGRGLTVTRLARLGNGRGLLASARETLFGMAGTPVFVVSFREAGAETGAAGRRWPATPQPPGSAGDRWTGGGEAGHRLVARSRVLQYVRDQAVQFARVDSPILISGETGTGKGVFARLIHDTSERRRGSYLVARCGGVPETQLDAELFGTAGAADPGAGGSGKPGLVAAAEHGTLLLDDVDQLPLPLQGKLLRMLDTGDPWSTGTGEPRRPDVRILAATTRDLSRMVEDGAFRKDLYYRLNVLTLEIPPLREHAEDIAPLVETVLDQLAHRVKERKRFSAEALAALTGYPFPGNVRELWNVVERAALATPHPVVEVGDLPREILVGTPPIGLAENSDGPNLRQALRRVEAELLRQALRRYGTQARAARHLGVAQATVARKAKQYGLSA